MSTLNKLKQAIGQRNLCPSDFGILAWLYIAVDGHVTDVNGHPLRINEHSQTWTGYPAEIALEGFNNGCTQSQVRASLKRLEKRGYIAITRVPKRRWTISLLPLAKEDRALSLSLAATVGGVQ